MKHIASVGAYGSCAVERKLHSQAFYEQCWRSFLVVTVIKASALFCGWRRHFAIALTSGYYCIS